MGIVLICCEYCPQILLDRAAWEKHMRDIHPDKEAIW